LRSTEREGEKPIKHHVAIFLPTLVGGGAERVMMNLAVGLEKRGHQVDFILAQREGAFSDDLPASVHQVELNQRHLRFGRSVLSLPALVKYLRKEKPEVLLTGLHANIIALWAKKLSKLPTRFVITEHNNLSIAQKTKALWYRLPSSFFIKSNYPDADSIIAVSNGVAQDLCNYANLPNEKIKVIYNPIITSDLKLKSNESLDHPWFQKDQPPVILAIGRLTQQKDFPLLLSAFELVREKMPVRLMILGEGPERETLLSRIKDLNLQDEVILPGFIHNPYPIIKKASVFALSSRWEGLPTVLVEALYCGTPIVSTDCPSGPKEILQNGKFGELVPVGNHIAFADALLKILKNPPLNASSDSWKIFETEFVLDQYEQLLFAEH